MNKSRYRRNINANTTGKFHTLCTDSQTGEVIEEQLVEAINSVEAEARAYANCHENDPGNQDLSVKVISE